MRRSAPKIHPLLLHVGAVLLLWGGSTALAAYVTMVNNGPSSNRVDIVFLGDGYTASDLAGGTYVNHINAMVNHLFNQGEDPFPRYQNFFNVHRVDVVSNESGADVPPLGIYRDTALDASYYWDGTTDRLLYVSNSKANAALSAGLSGAGFSAEMKLVTVNDTRYGGGGGTYAVYAGGNSSAPEIALHESGHSFAGLADEYDYPYDTYTGSEPSQVNITANSNPATVKWSNWVGYTDPAHSSIGAVGVYEGAGYYVHGLYRPTQTSKMRALNQPFNAVSREQMILSIYNYVDPLDAWLDNSSTLVDPVSLWVDTVDPAVIGVQWYLDGSPISGATSESLTLAGLGLAPGQYQITALAADTAISDWIRRDVSQAQESISWTVQLQGALAPKVFFDNGDPTDNNWMRAANWDTDAEPVAGQDAYIGNGLTAVINQAGEVADNVFVGHAETTLPGTGTLTVSSGSLQTGNLNLGNGGNGGNVNQYGGTVTLSGDLKFGASGSTGGTYQLFGGTLNVGGKIQETAPAVDLAQFHLDGGTLNVTGDITVQRFAVGQNAGRTGDYTLTGGKSLETTGTLAVGSSGTGTLTLDDGTLTVLNAVVGETASGDGTVSVEGGTFTASSSITVGSSGKGLLRFTGGTGHVFQGITVGGANAATSDGTLTIDMPSDADEVTATAVLVGNQGKGTFNLVKGTFTATAGFRLAENVNSSDLGGGDDRTAHLTIGTPGGAASPTLNVSGGNFETANNGTGVVVMHRGTLNQLDNNLIVGQAASADASFTINDGLIDAENQLRVGNTGKGVFTQNGGTVRVGTTLDLGNVNNPASDGTYNMNRGFLYAGDRVVSNLIVGNAGKGTFNLSDGTVDISNALHIAETATAVGDVTISGGSLTANGGDSVVGQYGQGTLSVTGGTTLLKTRLLVADVNDDHAQGDVSINLTNAADSFEVTGDTLVGVTRAGTLNITGAAGTVTFDTLVAGYANLPTAIGTVTVDLADSAHEVTATDVAVGQNGKGTFNLVEGTFSASVGFRLARTTNASDLGGGDDRSAAFVMGTPDGGTNPSLNVSGGNFESGEQGTGVVTVYSGTLNQLDSNLILGQVTSSRGTFNMEDGLVTLSANSDINSNDGNGTLNLNGGTIDAGRDLNLSTGNGASATVNINPGGTLVIQRNINYRNNTGGNGTDIINLVGGTLDMTGGSIVFANGTNQFNFTAGLLKDVGLFGSTLTQDGGTLAPGGSVGMSTVQGNYPMNGGALEIEINGLDQGDQGDPTIPDAAGNMIGYDFLLVQGNAVLDGDLQVVLTPLPGQTDPFSPNVGDYFDVIQSTGSMTGDLVDHPFDHLLGDPAGVHAWAVTRIDLAGGGSVLRLTAVPEPSSITLAAFGLLGLAWVGWRRWKRN